MNIGGSGRPFHEPPFSQVKIGFVNRILGFAGQRIFMGMPAQHQVNTVASGGLDQGINIFFDYWGSRSYSVGPMGRWTTVDVP